MKKLLLMTALIALGSLPMRAQERVNIPFRDPSMPRQVVIDGMVGTVEVTAYNGQEVLVETTGGPTQRRQRSEIPPGMHRVGGTTAGLDITEENNTVRLSSGMFGGRSNIKVQVPAQTSLRINTMGNGPIRVDGVNGDIEVQNMNGSVDLQNVSGSVVAHSMNGKVTVSMNNVAPNKPLSFSTMNGTIDVTLPASLKANLKMRTDSGDIFTDFEMQVTPSSNSFEKSTTKSGRALRWQTDRTTSATINGGGPEIQFTSFRGDILIHKK